MLYFYKTLFYVLLISSVLTSNSFASIKDANYVVILQSTSNKYDLNKVVLPLKFKRSEYKIYQLKHQLKNKRTTYRLTLGFFKDKKDALSASDKLKKKYSRLWVKRVSEKDKKIFSDWKNKSNDSKGAKKKLKSSNSNKTLKTLKNPEKIMGDAKKAMTDKNYRLAIGLYSKVVNSKESKFNKTALEYLGVAREKNNQLIHARAEYRLYIKKYLEGEDTERVKQRLLALNTVLLKPKRKLKRFKSKLTDWQHFGSFSQFYRSDTTEAVDVINSTQTESSSATLSSVFNYISRKRTDSLHIKSQLTASHLQYFDNPTKDERARINILFIDFASANSDKSIRIGRQSQNRAGVLGRMDGIWADYRLSNSYKVNMVAGYPVNTTSSNHYEKNKFFKGVSVDVTSDDKTLEYNYYAIEQEVDSMIDRQAIGTEIRYRKDNKNHFLLIDYDKYYEELNTVYFVGNWRVNKATSLIATLNYRNSPILLTSNALQGQGTQTIDSLKLSLTEDEIKELALARTARYSSASLGAYVKLSKVWDFNTDLTVANLESTQATSANPPVVEILQQEGTGNEFYYNIQFLSKNIFSFDETNKYLISYYDTKSYVKTRYLISSSFKYNKKWRFRPKLTFEDRQSTSGRTSKRTIPAIRIDYKVTRHFKWEFDASYGISKEISTGTNPIEIRQKDLNMSLGFIWDF